jgi:hypothetical protein
MENLYILFDDYINIYNSFSHLKQNILTIDDYQQYHLYKKNKNNMLTQLNYLV